MGKLRHFLQDDDISVEEQNIVLDAALALSKDSSLASESLKGASIGLLFEKPSLRTRVSSEVGCNKLGANPVQLRGDELHFGRGETPEDSVKVLSGYLQLLMGRVNQHSLLEELARYGTLPIVNGLSNRFHPLQSLADLLTLRQVWGEGLKGKTVCYVGDGNNVCSSLLLAGAMQGMHMRAATPKGLAPEKSVLDLASNVAGKTGGSVSVIDDPEAASDGADVLYTDVWISMGEEQGASERRALLQDYQINSKLLSCANDSAIVLHCLPAHRGEEIESRVIDGTRSRVFQQAHNRLPATMALFLYLLKPSACEDLRGS